MPRNGKSQKPAFFQVGQHIKNNDIIGMCMPDLSSMTPEYGRKAAHYVPALLDNMGGTNYYNCIFTPDATVKLSQ
eukprot:8129166-Ditylum_brightwellii.AAC.2